MNVRNGIGFSSYLQTFDLVFNSIAPLSTAYVERMRLNRNKEIKYNILVMDWGQSACASTRRQQQTPQINTVSIGKTLADFLVFLHRNDLIDVTKDAHIIGHSVGAHIAGQAGRHVLTALGKPVNRITGNSQKFHT